MEEKIPLSNIPNEKLLNDGNLSIKIGELRNKIIEKKLPFEKLKKEFQSIIVDLIALLEKNGFPAISIYIKMLLDILAITHYQENEKVIEEKKSLTEKLVAKIKKNKRLKEKEKLETFKEINAFFSLVQASVFSDQILHEKLTKHITDIETILKTKPNLLLMREQAFILNYIKYIDVSSQRNQKTQELDGTINMLLISYINNRKKYPLPPIYLERSVNVCVQDSKTYLETLHQTSGYFEVKKIASKFFSFLAELGKLTQESHKDLSETSKLNIYFLFHECTRHYLSIEAELGTELFEKNWRIFLSSISTLISYDIENLEKTPQTNNIKQIKYLYLHQLNQFILELQFYPVVDVHSIFFRRTLQLHVAYSAQSLEFLFSQEIKIHLLMLTNIALDYSLPSYIETFQRIFICSQSILTSPIIYIDSPEVSQEENLSEEILKSLYLLENEKEPLPRHVYNIESLADIESCEKILSPEEQKNVWKKIQELHTQEKIATQKGDEKLLYKFYLELAENYRTLGNLAATAFYGSKIFHQVCKNGFEISTEEDLDRIIDLIIAYLDISCKEFLTPNQLMLNKILSICAKKQKALTSQEKNKIDVLEIFIKMRLVKEFLESESKNNLEKTEKFLQEMLPKLQHTNIFWKNFDITFLYVTIQISLIPIKNGIYIDEKSFFQAAEALPEFPVFFLLTTFSTSLDKKEVDFFALFSKCSTINNYVKQPYLKKTSRLALMIFYFEYFFKQKNPTKEIIQQFRELSNEFLTEGKTFKLPSQADVAKSLLKYIKNNKVWDSTIIKQEIFIVVQMTRIFSILNNRPETHDFNKLMDEMKQQITSSPYYNNSFLQDQSQEEHTLIHDKTEEKHVSKKLFSLGLRKKELYSDLENSDYDSFSKKLENLKEEFNNEYSRYHVSFMENRSRLENSINRSIKKTREHQKKIGNYNKTSNSKKIELLDALIFAKIELLDPIIFSYNKPEKKWIERILRSNEPGLSDIISIIKFIRTLEARICSKSFSDLSSTDRENFKSLNNSLQKASSSKHLYFRPYYFSHCLYIYIQTITKLIPLENNADDLFFVLEMIGNFIKNLSQNIDAVNIGIYYLLHECSRSFSTIREKISANRKETQWGSFIDAILKALMKIQEFQKPFSTKQVPEKIDELKSIYNTITYFVYENMKSEFIFSSNDWEKLIILYISHSRIFLKGIVSNEIKKMLSHISDSSDVNDAMTAKIFRGTFLLSHFFPKNNIPSISFDEDSTTSNNLPERLTIRKKILSAIQKTKELEKTNINDACSYILEISNQLQFINEELSPENEEEYKQKIFTLCKEEENVLKTQDIFCLGSLYQTLAQAHHLLNNEPEMLFYSYLAYYFLMPHYKSVNNENSSAFFELILSFIKRYEKKYTKNVMILLEKFLAHQDIENRNPSLRKLQFSCLLYLAYYSKDLNKRKIFVNLFLELNFILRENLFNDNELWKPSIELHLKNLSIQDTKLISDSKKELLILFSEKGEFFSPDIIIEMLKKLIPLGKINSKDNEIIFKEILTASNNLTNPTYRAFVKIHLFDISLAAILKSKKLKRGELKKFQNIATNFFTEISSLKKPDTETVFKNLIEHVQSSQTLDFSYIRETFRQTSILFSLFNETQNSPVNIIASIKNTSEAIISFAIKQGIYEFALASLEKIDPKYLARKKEEIEIEIQQLFPKQTKAPTEKLKEKTPEEKSLPSKESKKEKFKKIFSFRKRKTAEVEKSSNKKPLQRSNSVINIRKRFESETSNKTSLPENKQEEKNPNASPRSSKPKLIRTHSWSNFLQQHDKKRLSINSLKTLTNSVIEKQISLLNALMNHKDKYTPCAFSNAVRMHLLRIFQLAKNLSKISEDSSLTTEDSKSNSLRDLLAYQKFDGKLLIELANIVNRAFHSGTLDSDAFRQKILKKSTPIPENFKNYFALLKQQQQTLRELLNSFSTQERLKTEFLENEEFLWICLGNLSVLVFTYRKLTSLSSFQNPFSNELKILFYDSNLKFRNPIAHETTIDFTEEKKLAQLSRILWKLTHQFKKEFAEKVEMEEEEITSPIFAKSSTKN